MVPFIGKGPPTDLAVSSDDILFVYHIILFYILCITFQGITVYYFLLIMKGRAVNRLMVARVMPGRKLM
ncbi:hypothetical protein MT325_m189L [Paramecium bursaria chlorella virus MT325]|uniref:Uncharacterized protein m189L n=1 Tax=Paramecium bursaria Chlorella virus MT325 TaxID=346932 RepID=A7ITR9_PBCVM|nr:hypothetical protein MT325_m189L [Paramecium bursaria chlorella virus MT325]